jgi:hypothetical protein
MSLAASLCLKAYGNFLYINDALDI